ncbi:hypothetical protein [Natrialba taiwanensis]|uniref:Uncharacterized protein n=1 Tax=Natrialba taiwanensis DSM 12281 TaxID=1230458 RepID=M0AFA8_9EURY|nr:hypothetical protein [Natrialba taiwanensis]ELY96542.1 hypothetical protein C484_00925 [Natrialba taiwanensis DSM 12281]
MSTSDTTASASFTIGGPEPLVDDAERRLVGESNPLVYQAVRVSHGTLRSYASRTDYDIEAIEDSFGGVEVDRTDTGITVTWRWDHPAAIFMNNGTSDHTIHGDPVLSFIWEDPPASARERWPDEGDGVRVFTDKVSVSGLPQSRFVQSGLEWLRQEGS